MGRRAGSKGGRSVRTAYCGMSLAIVVLLLSSRAAALRHEVTDSRVPLSFYFLLPLCSFLLFQRRIPIASNILMLVGSFDSSDLVRTFIILFRFIQVNAAAASCLKRPISIRNYFRRLVLSFFVSSHGEIFVDDLRAFEENASRTK